MDIDILVWLQGLRSDALTQIMSFITKFGSEIAAIAIACFAYWCLNRRTGNRMMLTMLGGLMLNQLLKIVFVAHRPWVRSERVQPVESAIPDATGYSFPSGHTANATSAYGGLTHDRRVKTALRVLSWVLIALIGFSRVYLGVHTPQDVLVSLALGVALIFLMDALSKKLESRPKLDVPIALGIVLIAAATLLITLFRSYPAGDTPEDIARNTGDLFKLVGAVLGMTAGWLLERRTIRFEKPANFLTGLMRFALGLVVVLALLRLPKSLLASLLGDAWGGLVRYMITCFGALYLWPRLFTLYEGRLTKTEK